MAKIKLENVSFFYGKGTAYCKEALKNVNIEIQEGSITGLIGHTGSGKSTMLQLLNGLATPAQGKVYLDGVDIWEKPKEISKVRFRVGLVMQYPEYQLFEETAKRGVIIVAGGSGRRMQSSLPKQFMILGGEPVVARTINTFSEALPGADIVVVLPEEHIALWKNLAARFDVAAHRVVAGGKERYDSVKAGIEALSAEVEYIAVHDGVRALVSKRLILRTILEVEKHDAVIPVVDVVDSIRRIVGDDSVIVPRGELRAVQTPQVFRAEVLRHAYTLPYDVGFTDDASVVEAAGGRITLIEGERQNIKLTTPEDMAWAESLLQ